MSPDAWFQVIAFAVCSFIGLAGALGMTTTMSMFRSGIFLMASFIGVAGLFILLTADLLGLLQIMMYIGGMLVMILFMVLFMHDPGGSMMAGMEGMSPVERFFSLGLVPRSGDETKNGQSQDEDHAESDDQQPESHEKHQHQHGDSQNESIPKHDHASMDMSDGGMKDDGSMDMSGDGMMDMSMVTPIRPQAVWLAVAIAIALVALLLSRPSWHSAGGVIPDPNSAKRIGSLLMSKYMIGFEGAGFLILVGIFGAVLLARPSAYPDDASRAGRVAIDAKPLPVDPEDIVPLASPPRDEADEKPPEQHHDQHRPMHKGMSA